MNLSKFTILFFLIALITTDAISQNIFVYDQQTGKPVPNVGIFNKEKTITGLTNNLGLNVS